MKDFCQRYFQQHQGVVLLLHNTKATSMKFMMMISIVAIGTLTADAQYFKCQGRVYTRQDIARNNLLSKYIETKWNYTAPTSVADIESPVVAKKLRGYHFSSELQPRAIATPSIERANRYYLEKPRQQMYLRPLLDFVYSLYEPRYMPNGN